LVIFFYLDLGVCTIFNCVFVMLLVLLCFLIWSLLCLTLFFLFELFCKFG